MRQKSSEYSEFYRILLFYIYIIINRNASGGSKIPRRNGYAKGCLFSWRDAEFPGKIGVGVPEFIGKMAQGCKIFRHPPFFLSHRYNFHPVQFFAWQNSARACIVLFIFQRAKLRFYFDCEWSPSRHYWIRVVTLEVSAADPKMLPYPSLGNSARAVLYYSSSKEPSSTDYLTILISVHSAHIHVQQILSHHVCQCWRLQTPQPNTYMVSLPLPSSEPSPGQEYFLAY